VSGFNHRASAKADALQDFALPGIRFGVARRFQRCDNTILFYVGFSR